MSIQKFFRAGAMFVLGFLMLAIIAICWAGGMRGKVLLCVCAFIALGVFVWRPFHRKICREIKTYFSRVNELIEEYPLSIGGIAVVILIFCILGGGGAYRKYFGNGFSSFEPYLYPIGLAIAGLIFFYITKFTDRHRGG
ncbi:MAG: hypothetical protein HY981_00745 [Candidatus Magasanikbacteria bacterium]|nr:hypothetical protein [Candidatus Magasanikbacteria bacterium]